MKTFNCLLTLWLTCSAALAANVSVSPWVPTFQGIDLASGQQEAQTSGERNHRVLCLRVDLTDPDVKLSTTPRCTNCGGFETLAENTSHFLEVNNLQAAINGGFYSSSSGPNDTPLGTPDDVFGLAISQGVVVSPASNPAYAAAFLFTTNNQALFVPTNSPGTNTAGIYTAISGSLALLINGLNVRNPTPNDLDPRTALGLSEDRRYLYLMTIDGRQPGWSDGADFYNTGEWLLRFGAHDAINVDGGGSTTMSIANCQGSAVRINRSSFVYTYGRERNIGHNFGVSAKPLPEDIKELTVTPGSTTTLIAWRTEVETTTQVEYGPSLDYGSSTARDSRLTRNHVVTLTGLTQTSNYFFRALSDSADAEQFAQACQFTTIKGTAPTEVFGVSNIWFYTTNNLNDLSWTTPTFLEAGWGSGPGLLYVENSAAVAPKSTPLPPPFGQTIPRTYYFRTHFDFTGTTAGVSLTFSNYVDDGAVWYLNGAEIFRLRMPAAPAVIFNSTPATASACAGTVQAGDAATICPDLFTIDGFLLENLVQGDNVLAVEVHNLASGNDLVFGSALIKNSPLIAAPHLNLWMEGTAATLFWNGEGFTLQHSSDLNDESNWSDVPGPITQSPAVITNPNTIFYRLRN